MMRRLFWLACLFVCLRLWRPPVRRTRKIASTSSPAFSILGDLVRNVGGDRVSVTTLVGPDSDPHVYEPTPSDAKRIADAKLVFVNGFGLEGWLPRLVQSAGGKAVHRDGDDRHCPAQARLRCRSARLAIPAQRQDLCGQYS